MKHIKEILAKRQYKQHKKQRRKKDRPPVSTGWKLNEGIYTHPEHKYAWVSESGIMPNTFVAQTLTHDNYPAFNHGFKSLDQAVGWILYGKKGRA